MTKAFFKSAAPYANDKMALPVESVDLAIPFYETVMGFHVVSRSNAPHKSVVLARDDIQMGLAENGGDSSQEGCFLEVDNVEIAFAEFKANGLNREDPGFRTQTFEGGYSYRVFFVIAPDGLCYCIGEPQTRTGNSITSAQPFE
jgi:catechol 2,3-dioxygenase-like lactoylglutathione lyase family enzyme